MGLRDGDEEYVFLAHREDGGWSEPYVYGPLGSLAGSVGGTGHIAFPLGSAAIDLMRFTFQSAFTTFVPSVYRRWDLQHGAPARVLQ